MTDEDFENEKKKSHLPRFFFFDVNKRGHVFLAYMAIHSSYDLSCEKVTGKYVWARILTLLPGEWE